MPASRKSFPENRRWMFLSRRRQFPVPPAVSPVRSPSWPQTDKKVRFQDRMPDLTKTSSLRHFCVRTVPSLPFSCFSFSYPLSHQRSVLPSVRMTPLSAPAPLSAAASPKTGAVLPSPAVSPSAAALLSPAVSPSAAVSAPPLPAVFLSAAVSAPPSPAVSLSAAVSVPPSPAASPSEPAPLSLPEFQLPTLHRLHPAASKQPP